METLIDVINNDDNKNWFKEICIESPN